MSIFQPSGDPAYLAWLDANRNGYRTLLVVVATGARPWS